MQPFPTPSLSLSLFAFLSFLAGEDHPEAREEVPNAAESVRHHRRGGGGEPAAAAQERRQGRTPCSGESLARA